MSWTATQSVNGHGSPRTVPFLELAAELAAVSIRSLEQYPEAIREKMLEQLETAKSSAMFMADKMHRMGAQAFHVYLAGHYPLNSSEGQPTVSVSVQEAFT